MKDIKKGFHMTIVAAAGFGSTGIFAQLANHHGTDFVTLLAVRFSLAGLLFLVACRFVSSRWDLTTKQLFTLIGLGFTGYAVFTSLYFYGVSLIPASLAAFILAGYPLIVFLMTWILGDESMDPSKMLSLLLSTAGLFLVLGPAFIDVEWRGVVAVLLAATMYSVYVVFSNRILQQVHWIHGSTVVTLSSAAFFLLGGWVTGELTWPAHRSVWVYGTALAVCATFIAIGGFNLGLSIIGASRAAIVNTLEPFVTAILASFLFDEQLTLAQLLGGILITISIILLQNTRDGRDPFLKIPSHHKQIRY